MATVMDKIRILGEESKYDICASTSCSGNPASLKTKNSTPDWLGSTVASGVCHSYTPDGRCVSLFKVLFTNKCIFNCKYCFTQVCKEKASFTPQEYANTFMKLYVQNICEGVFLTSAVCGDADTTTQEMLNAVHLLRDKYHFHGYIHFKCLPGVSYSLLKEAVAITDRISINVEAPTKEYLGEIACQKNYDTDILTRQRWLKEIRTHHNWEIGKEVRDAQEDFQDSSGGCGCGNGYARSNRPMRVGKNEWMDEDQHVRRSTGYLKKNWDDALVMNSGQTTQFILGAAGESDFDVLKRLDWEYREIDLRRGYFSAFSPIKGTPLERQAATPLDREHRLYQTDWLLRRYHIPIKEVSTILKDDDNLPHGDPKIHLAKNYFTENGPCEINEASYDELLRVPGIGPLSAQRILRLRKEHQYVNSRAQLHQMGIVLKRAEPFIKINGIHQITLDSYFLGLL